MAMGKVTKSFKVTLDIARSISNREFSVVEGDTGNTLSITLNDDGKAVDLTGCRVLALFSKSNGETVCQDSAEQNGWHRIAICCKGKLLTGYMSAKYIEYA